MTPSLTLASRLSAAAALAGSCGLLAACGGTGAPAPATTHTVTVQAAASSTTSSAPAPAPTPAAPAGTSNCLASGLHAQLGVGQGAAGTVYQVIVLTNTSNATCTLYGYPGVSFVTGIGGSLVGLPATKDPVYGKTLITLAPGGKASFALAIHNAGAMPNCQTANVNWLRIYPPNDYGSIYVRYQTQACASQSIMGVSTVRAGASGASH
jgi:hypothetical protein